MFAALTVRCDSSPAASTATATSRNTVGTLADGSVTASELPAPMPVTALAVAPQAPWRLPRPSYPSPSHYYSYSSSALSAPTWGIDLVVISKYFIQLADFQHPP